MDTGEGAENEGEGESDSENNNHPIITDDKIVVAVQDLLERNLVSGGFPKGTSKSEIKFYLNGMIESLEHFGVLSKEQTSYLFSLYIG